MTTMTSYTFRISKTLLKQAQDRYGKNLSTKLRKLLEEDLVKDLSKQYNYSQYPEKKKSIKAVERLPNCLGDIAHMGRACGCWG